MSMNTTTLARHFRLLAPLATIPADQRDNGDADWFPAVDILEDADEYLFRIDLPEVEQKDIQLVVERDGLVISGVRPDPGSDGKECLRVERPHGYFERRFALPDDASRADIASGFEKGVLELHVRKVSPTVGKSTPPTQPV
jgi:HSP20 family protein